MTKTSSCLHVKYPLFDFSGQIFEKYSSIKFHENPFSGSRVHPDGRTEGWTDVTKPTVAFRNITKGPKSYMLKSTKFVNVQQQNKFSALLQFNGRSKKTDQ